MRETSGEALEFEQLRALVGRYVNGPLGRQALEEMAPLSGRPAIEAALELAGEALKYLEEAAGTAAGRGPVTPVSFGSIDDPGEALALLRIEGAALEGTEFRLIQRLLEQACGVREAIGDASARYPALWGIAGGMVELREVAREIGETILPDGSLADDASPALKRLRREIGRQKGVVKAVLERFLREHRGDGTLREEWITIRNGRFVAPVVAGQQRKAEGVIHGASGTGQTLFVEPLETIGLNNELVRLREEELAEQQRILRDLTARLRPHAEAMRRTARALGRLDFLFAAARFGREFDCTIPRLSAEGGEEIDLEEARHPLLEDVLKAAGRKVVPVSLRLDGQRRTLLISGPNTGGKTVAMKTVGLLALMAHAGLPVPARRAVFPCFDAVLADVGDHQSIEESLSSFSAHIAHVGRMLDEASGETLVLLDELGRATDPEEAGALGVAILDAFRARGAFTIASTHLLALKVYGANTPGVVNASMGFDDETLQPTYVLRLGVPGRSAALAIASRLGLPEALLEKARATMSHQERDIAQFLDELERRAEQLRAAEARLAERMREIERESKAQAAEAARAEKAKLKEMDERAAEALEKFEAEAREAIARIGAMAEAKKAVAQAERVTAKVKREFQEAVKPVAAAATNPALAEGARVRLRGVREPARVLRVMDGGKIEVQAGWMKMQVEAGDVEEVLGRGAAGPVVKNVSFRPEGPSWDVSYREINVIGQTAEEAVSAVDKFLDSAALAGVDRVRIVHGHGMGVLKRAVAELLKGNPHVARFYAALPAEGGTGATVAELK
jgi:DNA mismatch repair protein MutS2